MFHTLVVNAIERSPRGGLVSVAVTEQAGEALIDVTDFGAGNPE